MAPTVYYSTKTKRKLYFGPYCTYLCQSIKMATHTSCPRQVVMADHHTLYRGGIEEQYFSVTKETNKVTPYVLIHQPTVYMIVNGRLVCGYISTTLLARIEVLYR